MGLQGWEPVGSTVLGWDMLEFSSSWHPHLSPLCPSTKPFFHVGSSPLQHPVLSSISIWQWPSAIGTG